MKIDTDLIDHLKKQQAMYTIKLISMLDSDDVTDKLMAVNYIQSMIGLADHIDETIKMGIMTGIAAVKESKKEDYKPNDTIENWLESEHYLYKRECDTQRPEIHEHHFDEVVASLKKLANSL